MNAGFYVATSRKSLDEVEAVLICTDGSFEVKDQLKARGYSFHRPVYDPWSQRNTVGWLKAFASREEIEAAIAEIEAAGGRVIEKQIIDEVFPLVADEDETQQESIIERLFNATQNYASHLAIRHDAQHFRTCESGKTIAHCECLAGQTYRDLRTLIAEARKEMGR